MRRVSRAAVAALITIGAVVTLAAAPAANGEAATARYLASIKNNPSLLLAFLTEMPKGGDLHNHLSGAIYAESYLRWAAEDGLCMITATLSIAAGACDAAAGRLPGADVLRNSTLFNQAIDAMSMRYWDRSLNGHDHFFATFGRFGPISASRTADMLAEVATRAAAEHVSYLELMVSTEGGAGAARGTAAGWDPDLPRLRDTLLAAGFRDAVLSAARTRLDGAEARLRTLLKCGSLQADPGCGITIRYIYQVARASSPQSVFGQMLAGFEIASADARVVSVNLVQPEDDPAAVRDFSLQMTMLDYLHGQYPSVKLTLACRRTDRGSGPARGAAVSYARVCPDRARVAHRSRRRCDVRGRSVRPAARTGVEEGAGRDRAQQQRSDSRHEGQPPSAAHLSAVRRPGGAGDRRCGRVAIDDDAGVSARRSKSRGSTTER